MNRSSFRHVYAIALSAGCLSVGCAAQQMQRPERVQVTGFRGRERPNHQYLGGHRVLVIERSASTVLAALSRPRTYASILPRLRSFKTLPKAPRDVVAAKLEQGTLLVNGEYTARAFRSGNLVTFWLDKRQPHDIDNAFGWFEVTPLAPKRSRVEYRVWIEVGSPMVVSLFGGRIQRAAMSVPDRLREYLQ